MDERLTFNYWDDLLRSLGFQSVSHYKSDYEKKWFSYSGFYIGISVEEKLLYGLSTGYLAPSFFTFVYKPYSSVQDISVIKEYRLMYDKEINLLIRAMIDPMLFPLCIGIPWMWEIVSEFFKGFRNEKTC